MYHSQWRERADAVVNGLLHGEVTKASDIYLLDGLQPQPTRLIQGGEGPAWSPDGRKIGYLGFQWIYVPQKNNAGAWSAEGMSLQARQIQVMNADGSGRKQITSVPNRVWDFAWSPAEDKIAYCESAKDGKTAIVIVNADGTDRQELTKMGEIACAAGMPVLRRTLDSNKTLISSRIDGGKIAIILAGPAQDAEAVENARGELVGVPTLTWSPDGRQIAFTGIITGEPVIGVVPTNEGKARPLALGYAAQWSPDGKRLLFRHDSESSPSVTSIFVVNSDGSQPRKLVDNENAAFGLAWFPDGQSIVFASVRETKDQSEIFRLNIDGTGMGKIASLAKMSLSSPAVSPDGTKLIVDAAPLPRATTDRFDSSIWLFDLATRHEEMLVKGKHGSILFEK